jgi:hypothetical protein
LLDGLAKFISLLGKLIDAMGGLPGLLSLITAGFTAFIGPKMLLMLRNFGDGLKMTSSSMQK